MNIKKGDEDPQNGSPTPVTKGQGRVLVRKGRGDF
jgi:hypothetical protein